MEGTLGSYQLRRRIAVGGMGEVYLGEKLGPEGFIKPVVLKCVLPQLAKDPAFLQLFLDEARLAALLNHPNIAQVYDFGVADGVYFMAMEYVAGYTVDELRKKHRQLGRNMPVEHVACIASQVCQGLDYAHTLADNQNECLGLIHRDVSPHNLIVSIDGGVKIVDFGIAKARAGLTRVQAKGAVGKFGYISPEQARGEQVDPRTDVFSLGVCMWELLTNRRLHEKKLETPPTYGSDNPIPSLAELRPDVPKQLDMVLRRALAVDRADRFSSCREMHLELERFLAAMVHFAGQAALAQHIRVVVEGRADSVSQRPSGQVVEPAGAVARGESPLSESLEGPDRYEEVFGTQVEAAASVVKDRATRERASTPTGRSPPPRASSGAGAPPPRPETPLPFRAPRSWRKGLSFLALALVLGFFASRLAGDPINASVEAILDDLAEPEVKPPAQYRIVSEPPGATIYVDGDERGHTPQLLELRPSVAHLVELRKPGHATRRARVVPADGQDIRELAFELAPAGTLTIHSSPEGGSVSMDGIVLANVETPATLEDVSAGEDLRVTVEKAGFLPVTKTVKLRRGRPRELHFDLPPK